MNGATPLFPLRAFMAWVGKTLIFCMPPTNTDPDAKYYY